MRFPKIQGKPKIEQNRAFPLGGTVPRFSCNPRFSSLIANPRFSPLIANPYFLCAAGVGVLAIFSYVVFIFYAFFSNLGNQT